MRTTIIAAVLLTSSGCVTTVESSPPGIESLKVTRGAAVRGWYVVDADRPRGSVLRFETFETPVRVVYFVRNVHHQDIGVIDHLGRAYRYRPHAAEPEWVGSGTVLESARRILELGDDAELMEVPLERLEPADTEG